MPIHCPVKIESLSADEFEQLDYRVMGHAYASQNELGRLCDECAYEADLKARLLADGFQSVQTQVPLTVTHRDFLKKYFLDLIVDNALYELKAAATLVGEHETQLFNYLFLLGIQRGKLLNFRPPQVQGKIIATGLMQAERRRFSAVSEKLERLNAGLRGAAADDAGSAPGLGSVSGLRALSGGAHSFPWRREQRRKTGQFSSEWIGFGPAANVRPRTWCRVSHHGLHRKPESYRISPAPAAGADRS